MLQIKPNDLWIKYILLFALAILPHQSLLHYLFPIEIINKNFWLTVPLGISIFTMTYFILKEDNAALYKSFIFTTLLWLSGIWIGLHWFYLSISDVFVNTRPLLIFPLTLLMARVVSKDTEFRQLLLIMVIGQSLFQAFFGVIHIYIFPEVVTGTFAHYRGMAFFISDEWWKYTSREAGTLGNPSAYAEMICLGAFASCIFFSVKNSQYISKKNLFKCFCLWVLFLIAIIPSMSRVGIVFVSLPFCIFLIEKILRLHWISNRWLLAGTIFFIMALGSFLAIMFPHLLQRFQLEGMYPRTQINNMLVGVLFQDPMYFIFGLPIELLKSLRTPEGFGFGDNSFLRLASATGFPIFSLWIILIFYILTSGRLNWLNYLFSNLLRSALLLYLMVLLYLGDVLFNDGWIFMCALLINCWVDRSTDEREQLDELISNKHDQPQGVRI